MLDSNLGNLVKRTQSGDRDAADALVRRIEGSVRARIRQRLGAELRKRVDTEDIFQSAITSTLADLDRLEYRGERPFLAWVSVGVERRIRDAARHHGAARRDMRRECRLETGGDILAEQTSPSQGAVRSEIVESIQRAVESLPDAERQVVDLHSYQGFSFPEVARRMGLSGKDAARRLFRTALQRMEDLVEANEAEPEGLEREEG